MTEDTPENVVAMSDVMQARHEAALAEASAKAREAILRAMARVTSEARYVGGGTDSIGPLSIGWVPCGRAHGANVKRGKTWGKAILFETDGMRWANVAEKRKLLGTDKDLSLEQAIDLLAWHYLHPPPPPGPHMFTCHLCGATTETVLEMIEPKEWARIWTPPVFLLPDPDDPVPIIPKAERLKFWLCPDCVFALLERGPHPPIKRT